jgi:phospholipid/cholesterol/gamma-HCH transport system substrate-binding protein
MNTEIPRRQLAIAGLAAVVFSAAVGLVLLAYGRGDFDDTYELTAVFPTSTQGMFTDGGTEVKMRGINVGTVRGIELLPDGRVEVRFAIRDGVRIPATAEARIEPLSVFGPKYVNMITDGTEADAPAVPSGGELAKATTGTDLTDVLDEAGGLLSAVDTNDLVTIVSETSDALVGQGATLGRGIDAGAALSEVAHGRRDLIAPFLADLRTITGTTAARSDPFLDRTGDFDLVARLVADNADDLLAAMDGAATLATRGTQLIADSADDFDVTVRAMARILRTVHADRERIPTMFDAVGAFFDMLGAGMRLPGPDGKKMTALKGFITVDLCMVYGVCLLPEGGLGETTTPPLVGGGGGAPVPGGPGPVTDPTLGPVLDPILDPLLGGLLGPLGGQP